MAVLLWATPDAGPAHDANPMNQLLLKDHKPESTLVVPETKVARARYPAIDVHTHSIFDVKAPGDVDTWVWTMDGRPKVAVGTTIADRRRVGPGNFTPSLSQHRA